MQKTTFITNVFKMSLSMLCINVSGICYSIYISSVLKADDIGLFHLIMSIYSLALVVAVSGAGLVSTRLVADYGSGSATSAVRSCLSVCMITSVGAASVIYIFSGKIAIDILSSPQCAYYLKILSPSLIFMSVSAVITGCFTATGKVGFIVTSKITGELVSWYITFIMLSHDKSCAAIVIAVASAAFAEFVCNIILWILTLREKQCIKGKIHIRNVIRLCAPVAMGSYLRTGLVSAENVMMPNRLEMYGVSNALGEYGIVKGMSIPVMMFPSVFTNAFSGLIVPEIAGRRVCKMKNSIRYISKLSLEYVLSFAIPVSAVFLVYHEGICKRFYTEPNASVYLGLLSVLPVFMFTDTVTDSLLKGLDKQVASLRINIFDSILRVVIIAFFVPKYGISAYIAMLYISEIINLICSYIVLRKACNLRFPLINGVIIPFVAVVFTFMILKLIKFPTGFGGICFFGVVYIITVWIERRISFFFSTEKPAI